MASPDLLTIRRIDRQRFDDMLNMLPPVSWMGGSHAESFKMSECDHGDITTIFCRIGSDHFELKGDIRSSHRAIVERCRSFLQTGGAAASAALTGT
jgi:Protein of unknown function (DUF1419)